MLDDYEQCEIECERIRASNTELLDDFAAWLRGSDLTAKTINKHINNVDFYINAYLLYEDTIEPQEGARSVSMFLGYWFIKKAMWASAASIKSNAASLKKFYIRPSRTMWLQETQRIDHTVHILGIPSCLKWKRVQHIR